MNKQRRISLGRVLTTADCPPRRRHRSREAPSARRHRSHQWRTILPIKNNQTGEITGTNQEVHMCIQAPRSWFWQTAEPNKTPLLSPETRRATLQVLTWLAISHSNGHPLQQGLQLGILRWQMYQRLLRCKPRNQNHSKVSVADIS
jgi:hypothetical protein